MGIVVLFVICIAGAVISANIASGKGRDPAPFALLGFLLPLIGVIAASCAAEGRKEGMPS